MQILYGKMYVMVKSSKYMLGGKIVKLSKIKNLVVSFMIASLVFAFGALVFINLAPEHAIAEEQPKVEDLFEITDCSEAVFVDAWASGAGMEIGQVHENGAGVTFKIARPKMGAVKIGLWNTSSANVWSNGYILQLNGKSDLGTVGVILKNGSNEGEIVGEQVVSDLGEMLTIACYTVAGEDGATIVKVALNGEIVVDANTNGISVGNYINVYNESKSAFAFLSTLVSFEDVPAMTGGKQVFTLKATETGGGQNIGKTSVDGAGIAFRMDRPTSGTIKFGLWNTSTNSIWNDGFILEIKSYAEKGKVGIILKNANNEAIFVDKQVFTGVGEELSFECFPLVTEQGTKLMIRLNGQIIIDYTATGVKLGSYFGAYNELGMAYEIRSIYTNRLEDVLEMAGSVAVLAPTNDSDIGELSSITNGFAFKMDRPTSGNIRIGLWNKSDSEEWTDGNNVWSNGYILQIEGKKEAGAVSITLKNGLDEKEFAVKSDYAGLGEELTFECYKAYANGGLLIRIVLNGTEIITAHTQGVITGTRVSVWNEIAPDWAINSLYYADEAEILDYTAISEENVTAREIPVDGGYNLGKNIGINQGAKVKVTLSADNAGEERNLLKFGLFKAEEREVWGKDNDGYIASFDIKNYTLSIISGEEKNTYVKETSFADKLEGFDVTVEFSAVKLYRYEEEVGHILNVKVNGETVVNYINTSGKTILGSNFNVYNWTEAPVTVSATEKGFNMETIITGEGVVLGNLNLTEGRTVKLQFVPAEDYMLGKVVFNGIDVTADVVDKYYTIESVSESDVLEVEFKAIEYTYSSAEIKDYYEYSGVNKRDIPANGDMTLIMDRTSNYGIRFDLIFPVSNQSVSEGQVKIGVFKIRDGWIWGEGGVMLVIDPSKQTVELYGNDEGQYLNKKATFNQDWATSPAVSFEAVIRDYFRNGEQAGVCFTLKVNGEDLISYKFNDRDIGNHFALYNGVKGMVALATSYSLEELNYEVVGEDLGTVECDGIISGSTVVKITPKEEVKVSSVTLNGEDITDQLVSDGTGYKLALEFVSSSDKLVVTFVSMQITYEQADVKDLHEISGGIVTAKINSSASPIVNLESNENIGIAFAIEPNGRNGEIKLGLFKSKENDVWDVDGYILALNATNRKVWLIVMTSEGDRTVETVVAEYYIPAELGDLTSLPIEVSIVNGVQNGTVVAHKIIVSSMGDEILTYIAQADALALGTYINVYNNTSDSVCITTAEQMIELNVTIEGKGDVVDARAIEGENALLKLVLANGYHPTTATVNGTATAFEKRGNDYFVIIPNASASDDIVVVFDGLTYEAPIIYDIYDLVGAETFIIDKAAVNAGFGYVQGNGSEAIIFNITLPEDFDTKLKFGFFKDKAAPHIWNGPGIIVEITTNGRIYLRETELEGVLDETVCDAARAGKTFTLEIGVVKGFGGDEHVANYYYVKLNGEEILGYADYTCAPYGIKLMHPYLDKAQTIKFTSTYTLYDITSNEAEGLVEKVDRTVKAGEGVKINIGVLEGYVISSMTANGVDVTANLVREGMAYVLDIASLTEDVELVITTEKKAVSVSVEQVANASVELSANTVDFGGSVTLTVTMDAGYEVDTISVNGTPVTDGIQVDGSVVTYVLRAITEDTVITVTLVSNKYTVTVNEFEGGSATLSSSEAIANGSVTLTLTLEEGYQLVKITVNGQKVSIGTDGKLVINGITENKQIVVITEKIADEPTVPSESEDKKESNSTSTSKSGCGSSVSGGGIALVGMILVALAIVRRKQQD